jgi:hypothetical protein
MEDGMGEIKKQGQGLRIAGEKRKVELEQTLAYLGKEKSPETRKAIEAALASLSSILTGDLDHIPPMVCEQLSRWIESSKYLGLKEQREIAATRAAPRAV